MQLDFDILIPTLGQRQINIPVFLKGHKVLISAKKGRACARNELALRSEAEFFLFIDDDVTFSEEVFNEYIKPAIEDGFVIAYEGENPILCSRILGIPKQILLSVGGFDETFDIGEDQELGYALLKHGYSIKRIPRNLIVHKGLRTANWVIDFVTRARFIIRYKKLKLFIPSKRKTSTIGVLIMFLSILYYTFNNKRIGIKNA